MTSTWYPPTFGELEGPRSGPAAVRPAAPTAPAPPGAGFTLAPKEEQLLRPARTNVNALPLHGNEVFNHEVQLIKDIASRPGGFVYLANWYARVHFYPWPSLVDVGFALSNCANKGGSIRALFWDGSLTREMPAIRALTGNLPFLTDWIRKQLMDKTNHAGNSATAAFINTLPRAIARLDDATLFSGSHHQKIFVVGNRETTVAIVGGVDLNPNRIATSYDRAKTKPEDRDGTPYVDVSVQLDGEIAVDIADLFEERWQAASDSPKYPLPPRSRPSRPRPAGGATVQLGPNFGCGQPLTRRRYPIRSGGALIRNALANCRSFFYAEDQYGIGNRDLEWAIGKAFANGARYGIVVLTPAVLAKSDIPEIAYRRHRFWTRFPQLGKNLLVFERLGDDSTERGEHAYVHSKLVIVDDLAATIGSMNMNRRSWYNDSELSVLITDAPDLIRSMRVDIWGLHLKGITASDDIRDPARAFDVWKSVHLDRRRLPLIRPISFAKVPPRWSVEHADTLIPALTLGQVATVAPLLGGAVNLLPVRLPATLADVDRVMDVAFDVIYDPSGQDKC